MTTEANKPATEAAPPVPGTPEHDAAMVARADKVKTDVAAATAGDKPAPAATEKPQKPADVPDKFWNADKGEVDYAAMAKSYRELESKLGQPKPAAPAQEVKAVTLAEQQALLASKGVSAEDIAKLDAKGLQSKYDELSKPASDPAKDAAQKAGVDFATLETEFQEKGALSPETYASLAAKGFDKAAVDTYIAGRQAQAATYDSAAFQAAGNEEAFKQMVEWAKAGLKPAEAQAFNQAVTSGDVERMKLAVTGLRASYEKANGKAPNLIKAGNTGTGAEGFKSMAEQKAAQRDPRYAKDPAYRAQVYAKIEASTFHNVREMNVQ